jgi:hypothetical protein
MITNRAKTFGDIVSPAGGRFVFLNDDTVHGKSKDEILQILSPTFSATSELRSIDIVVDITRPLTLFVKPNEPVNIATARVNRASPITRLNVRSYISLSGGVTLRGKSR